MNKVLNQVSVSLPLTLGLMGCSDALSGGVYELR